VTRVQLISDFEPLMKFVASYTTISASVFLPAHIFRFILAFKHIRVLESTGHFYSSYFSIYWLIEYQHASC